jgi:6-phosphofructokinase 1
VKEKLSQLQKENLILIRFAKELCLRKDSGKHDNLIIITEKMYDIQKLQKYIEEKLNISVRTSVLGFIQRGGRPSAFDRVLASKMGVKAVELLMNGYSGIAVGMKENKMISIDRTWKCKSNHAKQPR